MEYCFNESELKLIVLFLYHSFRWPKNRNTLKYLKTKINKVINKVLVQSFQNVTLFKMKFKYGCALETIDVTNDDINSLEPRQWLTDNIIYCFMSTFKKVHLIWS